MKNIFYFCSLIIVLYSPYISARENQASVLVFDASGSMWGKLRDGRRKIEVAKEVISDYLHNRNQNIPLGIVAYGHNRKGDCSDIEVLTAVKQQNHRQLANKLSKIIPKGKTPLTDALELAVRQIPKTAEEADIILITDGLETCGKDPCALAQKIADKGINIRAHVVGFGLTEKEISSLSCIPEKTGGHLLRPQTGKELSDALITVEEKLVEPSIVTLTLRLIYEKGSVRPRTIRYSAKNLMTNKLIDLGESEDTVEIIQGVKVELPKGTWLLMAEGPQGSGELKVRVKRKDSYQIPYQVNKAVFSLKNYGPYRLGQEQSYLLDIGKPMQKNLTLTAMLFPANAVDGKQRIDHEFLIGLGKGIREINFKSPKEAGKYKIVIGKSFKEQVASFDIEYEEKVVPRIKVPERVKPNEKFPYGLYGQWYRNNTILITQKGQKISNQWVQNTIEKEGIYLTAPSKEGIYNVSLRYRNTTGKYVTKSLATLLVGETNKEEKTSVENLETQQKKVILKTGIQTNKTLLPFAPAKTFTGDWVLTSLDISGDKPELLLMTKIFQLSKETIATGEITLAKSELLGQKQEAEKIYIQPRVGNEYQSNIIVSFKTDKGEYTAQLRYHPTNFDERIEAWGGPLYLNGKEVAVVLFENTTVTKKYESQATKDGSRAEVSSDLIEEGNKFQMGSIAYEDYQGRWTLYSEKNKLLRITVENKKGDKPSGAYFSVYEESENLLGRLMHEDEIVFMQKGKQLSLHFKTLKANYQVQLNQESNAFFENIWQGAIPSFKRTLWTGYLKQENGKNIPVYIERMVKESGTSITTQNGTFLYDTSNLDELGLVFTCKQKSCTYDDKSTQLKTIPLLKNWAIQSPYFYATASGEVSKLPTVMFIHTKTGVWFVLNQRQANSEVFDCLEFGKEGRLSSEEKICSPKNIPSSVLGDMATLIENIESWRVATYE